MSEIIRNVAAEPVAPRSWKGGVLTPGDKALVFNALRFATRDEAQRYIDDLFLRWTAVEYTEVVPSDDAPNYSMTADGKLVRL